MARDCLNQLTSSVDLDRTHRRLPEHGRVCSMHSSLRVQNEAQYNGTNSYALRCHSRDK